jgi:DNA-directed RNA polymerase specialized sigma24 family protein
MADLDRHLPGIAAGDDAAFALWLAGAEPQLRDGLRAFAAAVDAEAVIQEALLRAWQAAPRLAPDGRPNALLRFAVRAARNLALDEVRRSSRREPADGEALQRLLDSLAGDDVPEGPDPLLRRLIQRCREILASKPRAALDARLSAGGTEPDAVLAARLGMRVNTFLQNFGRARRALADCLRKRGVDVEEARP